MGDEGNAMIKSAADAVASARQPESGLNTVSTQTQLRRRKSRSQQCGENDPNGRMRTVSEENKRRTSTTRLPLPCQQCSQDHTAVCRCTLKFYRRASPENVIPLRSKSLPRTKENHKKTSINSICKVSREKMSTQMYSRSDSWNDTNSTNNLVVDYSTDVSFANLSALTGSTAVTNRSHGDYYQSLSHMTSVPSDVSSLPDDVSSSVSTASPVDLLCASLSGVMGDRESSDSGSSHEPSLSYMSTESDLFTTTSLTVPYQQMPRSASSPIKLKFSEGDAPQQRPTITIRASPGNFRCDPGDGLVLEQIATSSDGSRTNSPSSENGDVLWCTALPNLYSRATGPSLTDMPDELTHLQIQEGEFRTCIQLLLRCGKVRHHVLLYNRWMHSALFAALFVAIWVVGCILWYTHQGDLKIGAGIFFALAVSVVLMLVLICNVAQRKKRMKEELGKISLTNGNDGVNQNTSMKTLVSDSGSIILDASEASAPGPINNAQLHVRARDLIFEHADEFVGELVLSKRASSRLRPAIKVRDNHVRGGKCFCEFLHNRNIFLKSNT